MKKVKKICAIVTTAILTLANLWQLAPDDFMLKREISIMISNALANATINILVTVALLVLCSFSIATMVGELRDLPKVIILEVGSKEFCQFFSEWYSQPGILSVICDDLDDWLDVNDDESILEALQVKSEAKQLHLFLGEKKPFNIVKRLEQRGAIVHSAPKDIISNYSFSCISVMGNNASVIIRNKQKDEGNKIQVEEISNPYVTGVLNVLIKNIN